MGVSLGESPGFPWGKSRRLKWAEKRGFHDKIEGVKLLYILLDYHTENTESTEMFYPEEGVLHGFYKN